MSTDSQSSSCSYSTYSYDPHPCSLGFSSEPLVHLHRLERGIDDKVYPGIDIIEFAQQVWGLDSETIDKLLSMPVSLVDSEKEYYKQCGNERDTHRSFLFLADYLLKAAAKELGDESSETLGNTFWDRLSDPSAEHRGRHMPDIVNLPMSLPSSDTVPNLSLARGILELKRKDNPEDGDGSQDSGDDSSSETVYYVPPEDSTTYISESAGEAQETATSFERTFDFLDHVNNVENGASEGQSGQGSSPLRGCRLPLYAMETLASSCRYYVTGLIVDGFQVTVCYFDRFLVACATSFSFEDEPSKLALALYALNRCDLLHAGFDPHLRKLCSHGQGSGDDISVGPTLPVEDVVGSYFEYPAALVRSVDAQPSTPVCLLVSEVIRRPKELIGRATAVYKVRRRLANGTISEESNVYKLSWPPKRDVSEVGIVALLKQRLPEEAHDHLPEFLCTTTFAAQDLDLPWLRLGINLDKQERILRGTLGKFYHQLWEAGSIDIFERAWLDCVECLHLAHRLGKTLHRDLSERDLMVSKLADGNVKGVLNGWESSTQVGGDDTSFSGAGHRISTLPFMAYESHPHYFRHSLESMFYILVWAALHYNLKDGVRDTVVHPSVAGWMGDVDMNRRSKLLLITFEQITINAIQEAVKPEFAQLYKKWIRSLRALFLKARDRHYIALDDGEFSDPVTWGGGEASPSTHSWPRSKSSHVLGGFRAFSTMRTSIV